MQSKFPVVNSNKKRFQGNKFHSKYSKFNVKSKYAFIKKASSAVKKVEKIVFKEPVYDKSYWRKRSDGARRNFSRMSRYWGLSGTFTDARMKSNYRSKFVASKYLSWKMGLSVSEVRQLSQNCSLSNHLILAIVNIIVILGFYANYTLAKAAIKAKEVFLNGSVIANIWHSVKVGDVIIVVTPKGKLECTPLKSNAFVQIEGNSIYIKNLPNVQGLQLFKLNQLKSLR